MKAKAPAPPVPESKNNDVDDPADSESESDETPKHTVEDEFARWETRRRLHIGHKDATAVVVDKPTKVVLPDAPTSFA